MMSMPDPEDPTAQWVQVPTDAMGPVTVTDSNGNNPLQGRIAVVPGSNGQTMFFPIAPLPSRSINPKNPNKHKQVLPAGAGVRSAPTSSMALNKPHLVHISTTGTGNGIGIGIDPTISSVTGAGAGIGSISPLTDSASFLGDFDPSFEDSEYPPGPGRKKRKTPAFQLSSGRHDGCSVYDGDVIDGTDRHNDLPPIMLDPPALSGSQGHDDGAYENQERTEGDGGFRERYGRGQADDDERAYSNTNTDQPSDQPSTKASNVSTTRWTSGRLLKPSATRTCEFRKLLFLRRKAALITLFLDATSAIKTYWKDEKSGNTANMSKNLLAKLPEVDSFEKLLPALEDVGVGGWPPDQPGWRVGDDDREGLKKYGSWKGNFAKRKRTREGRREIVRGGWAPEGSFEFEKPSRAGSLMREGAKARAALQRLAIELRHILLTVKPTTTTSTTDSPRGGDDSSPNKTKRRTEGRTGADAAGANENVKSGEAGSHSADTGAEAKNGNAGGGGGDAIERVVSGSKDGSEGGSGTGGKKKPKKKKRSVLANQSNPHHVNNYRSTRTLTSAGDPNEPYPSHASLLFPPSMSFLSARPSGQRVRASEEDYICSFCEYDLFYGTERQRKAAIRRRRQELKRKENIKNKAKHVADGNKTTKEDESEYDDDDDGVFGTEECEDQGYGKCSCGRALAPHGDKSHHLKPPDPDPWPDPFPNGIPERVEDLPTSLGGSSYMIPLLPPVLQRQIEAEAERQLELEKEGTIILSDDEAGSRASTPSID